MHSSMVFMFLGAVLFMFLGGGCFGEQVIPTIGSPWPYPALMSQTPSFLILKPTAFSFRILGKDRCEVGDAAVSRYLNILKKTSGRKMIHYPRPNVLEVLNHMNITINAPSCYSYPAPFADESYKMKVRNGGATLNAETVWGVLRGLETFVQLAVGLGDNRYLLIQETVVDDYPRFGHRGLLIDTSRHFLPVPTILTIIEAMEMNKMNVLHWHIVDDESFPYQSSIFPQLSEKGAYDPDKMVYTESDINRVTEFARLRGIRVVPEFDTPGHTRSWGKGIPELVTECEETYKTRSGPIDPSVSSNYGIFENLFQEISRRFPDQYIHLGGDEVNPTCWLSNQRILDFMESMNMTRASDLEDYHMRKILEITDSLNYSTIVWQEPFERGVRLPKSTIVQVWLGDYQALLKKVTKAGYKALLSTCWYLDHVTQDLYGGGGDWKKFYTCNPVWEGASKSEEKMIAGGEACMWGELVDESNVVQRIWPRASAAAEVLWSPQVSSIEEAASRLEEHACRMKFRNIPAQPPNGPGFCI